MAGFLGIRATGHGLATTNESLIKTSLGGLAKRKQKKQPAARDLLSRSDVLQMANEAVSKSRNVSYGEPQDDFACTAELWDSYVTRITQVRGMPSIWPSDISAMMILLKISRLANSPGEMDHWIDIAGYSAIGAEIAGQEETGNCCN